MHRAASAASAPSRARRLTRTVTASVAVLLTLGLTAPTVASALPTPKAAVPQPEAAEGMQPYVPQSSCDPVTRAGVVKFQALLNKTYKRKSVSGMTRSCIVGGKSEHYEGRALDFMLNAKNKKDKATADAIITWLLAKGPDGKQALQARRLGIMYIIWNHKIWGVWDGKWKKVSGNPHTDHIHFSFSWAGAKGTTSFWTGKVAAFDYGPCAAYKGEPARIAVKSANLKPCPTNLPAAPRSTHRTLVMGSKVPDVMKAQQLLKVPTKKRTRTFGISVRRAVINYQKAKKLPVTGALDKATWVKLDPKSRLSSVTVTSSSSASAKPAAWVNLRAGSTGANVLKVQTALGMPAAARTSTFDAATVAAVKAFQAAKGLDVDGVVGPITAKALGLIR